MAKAKQVAYLVTDKSPLSYNGKTAACGDIVTDIPGESVSWLLADGFIQISSNPAPDTTSDSAPTNATPDASAETTDGGSN